MEIKLPRLLDRELNEIAMLHPVRMSISERLTPPSDASMTLPKGESAPFASFVELYTKDGSAGYYRVKSSDERYDEGSEAEMEHCCVTLEDEILHGEGEKEGTYAEIADWILGQQTARINGKAPWVMGECAKVGETTFAYNCDNLLSALIDLAGDEKDGYALQFDDKNGFPWRVNIVEVETAASAEGRISRNLTSVSVTVSDDDLCTRVYCEYLPEPHTMDGETIGQWGAKVKTITAGAGVTQESLIDYVKRYLDDHQNPAVSIEISAVDLSKATGERIDSFGVGRLFRLALPDYGAVLEERILVMSATDVFGAPEEVRLTLASNIRDTAQKLVQIENTVTGGAKSNSTGKYYGSSGSGITQSSVLDMLKKEEEYADATEWWKKEAGIKIEANEAQMYATKKAITGGAFEDVETINALISATTDNGGLVGMMVGRKNSVEDVTAAIVATAEGGGLINLKADAKAVTELGERVNSTEILIDNANASILLKADTTVVDALGNRVSAAEIEIDGLNSEITLKADKVTIDAELTTIKNMLAGKATVAKLMTTTLSAVDFTTQTLKIGNAAIELKTKTVVTSVSGSSQGLIAVRDAEGNIAGTALTGYTVSYKTDEIYYYGS